MSTIFKDPKSSIYRIEYRVPGRDKPVRKSLKVKDRRRAEALQREFDRRLESRILPDIQTRTAATLTALLARYQSDPPKKHSESTRDAYAQAVKRWRDWNGADRLDKIRRQTVDEFATHLHKVGGVRGPLKAVSVNHAVKHLRCFIALCSDKKRAWYSGPNPFAQWEPLPEPQTVKDTLTAAEGRRLIECGVSTDAQIICALGFFAGLRINEILNAEWHWVDFRRRCFNVISDPPKFRTKSGKSRSIPMHSELYAMLETMRRKNGYIVRPDKEKGKARYRYDWRKALAATVQAAEIKTTVSPHLLRHTFTSVLIGAGVSETKVHRWLGHADKSITGAYIHLEPWDSDIEKL